MSIGSELQGGSSSPHVNPAQVAPYYLLALEYVDPALNPLSSLNQIFAALKARRAALLSRPAAEVRVELEKLDEITLFVQRIHRNHPDVPAAATALRANALAGAGTLRPTAGAPSAIPPARLSLSTPPAQLGAVEGATVRAVQPDYLEEQPRRVAQPAASLRPAYLRGLRGAQEARAPSTEDPAAATGAARQPARPELLPEQQVLPVAWGLALILWQAALAWGAGLTTVRLIHWPGGLHGDLSATAQCGLAVLGLLVGLGVLCGLTAYRRATRQLGLLVHLGAVVMLGYLSAWTHAAGDSSRLLDPPGAAWWILTVLIWLALGLAAYLRDLNHPRRPAERSAAQH